MSKKTLIIVESPSKAKKIQEYIGNEYIVVASKGHITDLAKNGKFNIGVDLDNFTPRYTLMEDKVSTLNSIMGYCKNCNMILLASDPDREGESIAWHLSERLKDNSIPIKRITFNEITKKAIKKSLKEVKDIDLDLVHAQEARRILDRIVGFMASPFLKNKFNTNLSAGRVQSVITKMIVEREREIENFVPEDYWNIHVSLTNGKENFAVKYDSKITNQQVANLVKKKFEGNNNDTILVVCDVIEKEERKSPYPPMITSKLQQIMSKDYGMSADSTMKAAQELYENGYVTYIRTDSTRINDDAVDEVRKWLTTNNYAIPSKGQQYPNKDASQDAHECIRPTEIELLPHDNYEIIDQDQKKVYEVIWKYFVASQMNPAIYQTLKVTMHIKNDPNFKAKVSGKALKEKGFLEIIGTNDSDKIDLPALKLNDELSLYGASPVKSEKKQTQPPARYSEANLIKELVNKDIGRPATYAELLTKISSRNYVEKSGNIFHATDLGKKITEILNNHFSFMDYDYTSNMEKELDNIANKKTNHVEMLKNFYKDFKNQLDSAYINNGTKLCDKCGSAMVVKKSKAGSEFYGCIQYPYCRETKQL